MRSAISCLADADGRALEDDLVDCAGEEEDLSSSESSSSDAADSVDRVETVDGVADDGFLGFGRPERLDDDADADLFFFGEGATESPSDSSPDASAVKGRDCNKESTELEGDSGNEHHGRQKKRPLSKQKQSCCTYIPLRDIRNLIL